jgi:cytochrome c-type biogenesis protein CcmH/NrfG
MAIIRVSPKAHMVIAFLVWRASIVGQVSLTGFPLGGWLIGCGIIAFIAMQEMVWPGADIAVFRFYPELVESITLESFFGWIFILFSLALLTHWWRRRDQSFIWLFWFWLFILPAFNFGIIGDYLISEKTIYLASFGLCVLLLIQVTKLIPAHTVFVGVLTLAALYGYQTYSRAENWRDTRTYLEAALEYDPDFVLYYIGLGSNYRKNNDLGKALEAYQEGYKRKPDSKLVRMNIAALYSGQASRISSQGSHGQAIDLLNKALEMTPRSTKIHNSIGMLHMKKGAVIKAGESFKKALQLDGKNYQAAINIANTLVMQKKYDEAERFLSFYLDWLDKNPPHVLEELDHVLKALDQVSKMKSVN